MLYITAFRNYDGFKGLFALTQHGNGVESRKNRILLNHLKTPSLHKWCREHNDYKLLSIRDMTDLKRVVLQYVQESGEQDEALTEKAILMGHTFYGSKYRTDEHCGVCEDYDKKSIRYVNVERDRVFKMKAGRFITSLIKETELGQALNESVVIWLGEVFSQEWETYTSSHSPNNVELVVDDDFETIYDPDSCKDFNNCSCMVGRNRHEFYEEAVSAKAASIIDPDGYVLARAIIFTDVRDQDGKKWRLLERQYSRDSSEALKRTLIDLLIKAGEIDGYKQVGAGCGDSRAFVTNDGESLSSYRFSIKVNISYDSTISYQDSFKYYDYNSGIAYNYHEAPHDCNLDTTDRTLDGDEDDDDDDGREWDDWHDRYCDETTTVYFNGREYLCDSEALDDFYYVEDEDKYIHIDECYACEECGKYYLRSKVVKSDITGDYYCCEKCKNDAEDDYKRRYWYHSEYEDKWFETAEELGYINVWDGADQEYEEQTISIVKLEAMMKNKEAWMFGGVYFDIIDHTTNLPYDYELKKKEQ